MRCSSSKEHRSLAALVVHRMVSRLGGVAGDVLTLDCKITHATQISHLAIDRRSFDFASRIHLDGLSLAVISVIYDRLGVDIRQ